MVQDARGREWSPASRPVAGPRRADQTPRYSLWRQTGYSRPPSLPAGQKDSNKICWPAAILNWITEAIFWTINRAVSAVSSQPVVTMRPRRQIRRCVLYLFQPVGDELGCCQSVDLLSDGSIQVAFSDISDRGKKGVPAIFCELFGSIGSLWSMFSLLAIQGVLELFA